MVVCVYMCVCVVWVCAWVCVCVCRSDESLTQMPSIFFEIGSLTSLELTQESRLVGQ